MSANDLPKGQALRVELLKKMSAIGKQPAAAGFATPEPAPTAAKNNSLNSQDALDYDVECGLADLIAWAKRTDIAIKSRMAKAAAMGVPFDARKLENMRIQLGEVIGAGEQKYQRSWHAHAMGLGARRAA